MAEDWRLCADWLVRCQILAPEHPAAKPTGQLQNLAAVLRDGVLMCLLLDRLHPGAVDQRGFSPHPQVSLFLCIKNVKSFLSACKTVFDLKDSDLFEPFDLVETAGFGKVIRTLSKLSQSHFALKAGIKPFHVNDRLCEPESEYMNPFGFRRDETQDDEDSDDNDYCNYSMPTAVMHNDVYGRLVDLNKPLSPKSKQFKSQKALCTDELVTTEEKFVAALQMIREKFMASLKPTMSPKDFQVVFKYIEQLHDVHSHFHQQLRLAVTKQRGLTVGECFLTCKEKFLVHGDYCSNLFNAQELLDKLSQNSTSFSAVLSNCQMAANEARFKLHDLLVLPMQRVLKYHLFLKELIKQTKNDDPEKRSLQHALQEIEDLSLFVNEVKRDNEMMMTIRSLQRGIVGLNLPTNTELVNYGRLVMDGELKVKCEGDSSQKTRHVFLLDKLVLVCKTSGESHKLMTFLWLLDQELDDTSSSGKAAMSFVLTTSGSSPCTFTAKTADIRRKWVNAIKIAKDNICPKFAREGGHNFVMMSFDRPTICDVCRKLLRGVFYQGYKCEKTGMAVHKECLEKAKDMSGPPVPVQRETKCPSVLAIRRQTLVECPQSMHDIGSPPPPCGSRKNRSMSIADPTLPLSRQCRGVSMTTEDFYRQSSASSDHVNEFVGSSWYAGAMSREEADSVLQQRPNGTFLIRQSVNPAHRGEYTLSVKYKTVFHALIQRLPNGHVYFAQNCAFGRIVDLVDYYRSNSLQPVYKEVGTALLFPFKQIERAAGPPPRTHQHIIGYCHAMCNFAATAPNQISLREGDRIAIISKSGEGHGWWKGRRGSQVGYFPYTYVTEDE